MKTRVRMLHGEVTVEKTRTEDLSALTDEELDAAIAERTAAQARARAWTATTYRALMDTATRHKQVTLIGEGVNITRALVTGTPNASAPPDLVRLNAAYELAQRDESAAKRALREARQERQDRQLAAAHRDITARHAGRQEARRAAHDAMLRQAVVDASRPPSIIERVHTLVRR